MYGLDSSDFLELFQCEPILLDDDVPFYGSSWFSHDSFQTKV